MTKSWTAHTGNVLFSPESIFAGGAGRRRRHKRDPHEGFASAGLVPLNWSKKAFFRGEPHCPVLIISHEQLAREVHAGGIRLVIAVTGVVGGGFRVGRHGRRVAVDTGRCGAVCPGVLVEWLEGKPDEFCSSWTARAMAMAAYTKAAEYDPRATVCGVACTASLASDRPKRGCVIAYPAFQERHDHAVVLGGA